MLNLNRTRAIAAGLAIGVALVLLIVWRYTGGSEMDHKPPSTVETVRAAMRDVSVNVSALGSLDADQSIVVSPEIDGVVTSIDFVDGQRLNKGDTIISIDSGSLKARLMQTQARVTLTRANFDRAERLRKQGSGTERALDEALNDRRSAEADLAAAQADLDKANITAPFTGIIGLRQVSLGQYLKAGDAIATLADVDHLRIDFRVSEVFLTKIGKDQEVGVKLDALPDETFKGVITAIDPVIDVAGRAIRVRAVLPNESGKLRPGLFGRVSIVTLVRNSVVLPESALVPQQTGGKAVFVVVDGGEKGLHAELRPVEIGERLAGEAEILSGVAAGDVVVTAGQLKIRSGDPVEPVAPAAPSTPQS
ncbi:MAG: efflux RND transporter periplasmic adaptor subunit [Parvibaculum sp.]|uniref:efflux RND transporter periplasmic adaptor subunit n=1 Tax=Parvibaculum sp. TaxID=2024848 RepID=UPI0025F1B9D0|nr:efflux RND transporter periplasmic adaptor subunit [Parvibaculum sp.]MCE9649177.1 efflux RND transporter periplasmic adaptor subunit [Parvibaculum sp.]